MTSLERQNDVCLLPGESTDSQSERPFIVPESDIKKRKKTDLEAEFIIKESSQAIVTACSAPPALLNRTTSKIETEEDKNMITVLLHGFKRMPEQQKTKCIIKLLETLESFNKNKTEEQQD